MSAEERIKALMQELGSIGPMLPGTLSKQYNVCGKDGCRCKDPVNPVRHGPYCQLSFTVGNRNSTMFVKSRDIQTAREMSNCWKRFKVLGQELNVVKLRDWLICECIMRCFSIFFSLKTSIQSYLSWPDHE